MTSTVRSMIASTLLGAAALSVPLKAQQYTADIHIERPTVGASIKRAELIGPQQIRLDQLSDGTVRAGVKVPLAQGFVSAFAAVSDTSEGTALNWDVGSKYLQLGGALEHRVSNANVTSGVNLYATSVSEHHRISLGTARIGKEDALHGIGYLFHKQLVGGIGFVKQAERKTRYHGSVASVSPVSGQRAAAYLYWAAEPGKSSVDLWFAPKGRWGRQVGMGPNQMDQFEHDRTLRVVDDIASQPIQPGIPPQLTTDGGNWAARTKYTRDHADQRLAVDVRVFPARIMQLEEFVLRNFMTGYRKETGFGADAKPNKSVYIGEIQIPIKHAGTLLLYGETSKHERAYVFAGLYKTFGRK